MFRNKPWLFLLLGMTQPHTLQVCSTPSCSAGWTSPPLKNPKMQPHKTTFVSLLLKTAMLYVMQFYNYTVIINRVVPNWWQNPFLSKRPQHCKRKNLFKKKKARCWCPQTYNFCTGIELSTFHLKEGGGNYHEHYHTQKIQSIHQQIILEKLYPKFP